MSWDTGGPGGVLPPRVTKLGWCGMIKDYSERLWTGAMRIPHGLHPESLSKAAGQSVVVGSKGSLIFIKRYLISLKLKIRIKEGG